MTESGGGESTTRPNETPIQIPTLHLRALTADDDELLRLLHSPAVSGPWDYFDDPPRDLLRAGSFGGGARIIVDAERGPVGDVSFIQVPYGPNVRSLAWRIGVTCPAGASGTRDRQRRPVDARARTVRDVDRQSRGGRHRP